MRTIIKIQHVEKLKDKSGKTYWRTHAVLDDGTEAVGFGKDFDLEDKVECFYHYGQVKIRRPTRIDN